jgi:toxin secretion/phage lysis holin
MQRRSMKSMPSIGPPDPEWRGRSPPLLLRVIATERRCVMKEMGKTMVATVGATSSFLFGGWSTGITILAVLALLDYVTGMLAGFYEKKLSSKIGSKGILKKLGMFFVIGMCHLVDVLLGTEDMLRDGAVFFYVANECLSIAENAGRMGIRIPAPMKRAIQLLHDKTEKEN